MPQTFPQPIEIDDMTPEEALTPRFIAAMAKMEKTCAALDKRIRRAAAKHGQKVLDLRGVELNIT